MSGNLKSDLKEIVSGIDISSFNKAKNYLTRQGFIHKSIAVRKKEDLKKIDCSCKGIYIFTFLKPVNQNFDTLWMKQKEIAKKEDARISPLNVGGSAKIMYVGETIKNDLAKRVKKHSLDFNSSKKTGSMKLGALSKQDFPQLTCHLFMIDEESEVIDYMIDLLEGLLHDQLKPRLGKK